MTTTVIVNWQLPTTRASGAPLDPADIDFVEIAASADGGANYGVLQNVAPPETQLTVPDLEDGEWFFRGVVVDQDGRRSDPLSGSITLDTSPPAALGAIQITPQ